MALQKMQDQGTLHHLQSTFTTFSFDLQKQSHRVSGAGINMQIFTDTEIERYYYNIHVHLTYEDGIADDIY